MMTRDAYDPVNYDYSERMRVVGARSNKMSATDVNVVWGLYCCWESNNVVAVDSVAMTLISRAAARSRV